MRESRPRPLLFFFGLRLSSELAAARRELRGSSRAAVPPAAAGQCPRAAGDVTVLLTFQV